MAIKPINKETKEFYEAANRSELLIQKCEECGEYNFFPRAFCPQDLGKVNFVKASGKGKIITYTIVNMDGMPAFKDLVPYVAAIVELEEGPTVNTRIEVENPGSVSIGQDVEVEFKKKDGQKVPLFHPID